MEKADLKMICDCCKKSYDVSRSDEIPAHVTIMRCNFCFECDINDKMTDYYNEYWDEKDNQPENQPTPFNPNQLTLFK